MKSGVYLRPVTLDMCHLVHAHVGFDLCHLYIDLTTYMYQLKYRREYSMAIIGRGESSRRSYSTSA